MNTEALLLIAGGDRLAERVCGELLATAGHRVRVVWPLDAKRIAVFRELGASVAPLELDSDDALIAAGVMDATSLLALSDDDGLNLSVALRARSLNANLRVVVRQFNVPLGAKIEQTLPNSTALSLSAHSAATFAAAALDRGCLVALRFPQNDGTLVGFTAHEPQELGIAGLTVAQAEERLGLRIVALGARRDPPAGAIVTPDGGYVTTFGPILERSVATGPANAPAMQGESPRERTLPGRVFAAYARANPILRTFAVAAVAFFSCSYLFFHFVLAKSWTAAAFYVVETMTNVGFGEVDVTQRGPLVTFAAIVAMIGGIVFTSIFIGSVASSLTRAQWVATQGLRRIRARGHVVICGGGKVGTAVLDLLTAARKRVIVIDPAPDADLVRRASERGVDLLTGDASKPGALALCDLANAAAVLALTNSDTTNLEIALGVRVLSPAVPLVVRMDDASFAHATTKLFGIATFSPADLTAPVFAGLARFPGTRGRVRYAGEDCTIGQRVQGAIPERPPADDCTPLCVRRGGTLVLIRDFADMQPYDTVLFSVPLGQFRARPAGDTTANEAFAARGATGPTPPRHE